MINIKKRKYNRILIFLSCLALIFNITTFNSYATQDELNEEAEERKNEPVITNEIDGWPKGPLIGAKAAILMDANSGGILYSKNIDEELFPASTTKIMTCLVAIENCKLDELITVNQSAINANDPDGSNMGLKAGDKLTLEEMLYGILINSANEACNAVAEHIAGSQEAYVEMMNEKAKELGCTHTHFVTTNGLQDAMHYVSARDLALIAREFFKYDILCKISSTGRYTISANEYHNDFYLLSHNKLTAGREYAYENLLGSKTGFTSYSRQTLVSCAEKNGVKLICVILREETPYQFVDTISLFDYGFNNFTKYNIASNETTYNIKQADYFDTGIDLFGYTKNLLFIDNNANILLPNAADFNNLTSKIVYNKSENSEAFATIEYSYNGAYVGDADVIIDNSQNIFSNSKIPIENNNIIFNINHFMIFLFTIQLLLLLFMILGGTIKKFISDQKRLYKIKKARKENEPKRRPVHKKYKKTDTDDDASNNGFSPKRKHVDYRKPERNTLYELDALKPGNLANTKKRENVERKEKIRNQIDDMMDIDIDEDD